MSVKRILTGIQPTGTLHIGNYFGAMKPLIEMQNDGETFTFIADYHALTSNPKAADLKERVKGVAIDYLACGIDPEQTSFFRQSDVPEVCELTWILSTCTGLGRLENSTSLKDKIAKGQDVNAGLFNYPILMASDILLYQSNYVPVGKDQKQHLEISREIAKRFNHIHGETFVIPAEKIKEGVALVPGTDGEKMSKSYNNIIEIFNEEKAIRKRFMKIETDSKELDDPKIPEECNVFQIYKLFASQEDIANLADRYRAGGLGYGHAKQEAFEKAWDYFAPMRKKRHELIANPDYVESVLKEGAEKARSVAFTTMQSVRKAVGLQ